MPLKSQTLPNKRLTGLELMAILKKHFHEMLSRDYAFTPNVAYGRVAVNLTVTLHIAGVTSEHVVRSYTKADGVIEGENPLDEPVEEEVHGERQACDSGGCGGTLRCSGR